MSLYDAIHKRVSTRTFQKEILSESDIFTIKNMLQGYQTQKGPHGHAFEFILNLNNNQDIDGKKIGTYGFFRNVPAYISGVCSNNREAIIDFGYLFERLILDLTDHNYDTCWIGGTFRRKKYRKGLDEHEIIPAISPVGFRSENRTLMEYLLRTEFKSKKRKQLSEMFVSSTSDFEDESSLTYRLFHAIQVAPSAMNKQPWRVVENGNNYHFYLERSDMLSRVIKYDMQLLDIGIALSHFEIALKQEGISCEIENQSLENKEKWEYITTVTISK